MRSPWWKWLRDGLVLFLVLSIWVPVMAAWGKDPAIAVGSVITFEIVIALLCFGITGALSAMRSRRSVDPSSS